MRILIAYDGSPSSQAALDEVLKRPWPATTRVRLVTVVEQPVLVMPPESLTYAPLVEGVHASTLQEARTRIQRAVEKFEVRPDLSVDFEIRQGNPKAALLEAIREWQADLVFAGSHGARGLERLFLGSVCHALVTHAPCTVEVVKLPRAA